MKVGQTSLPNLIPLFIKVIRTIKPSPNLMIDVGCGAGIYGLLFKFYNKLPKGAMTIGYNLDDKVDLRQYYDLFYEIDLENHLDYFMRTINYNLDVKIENVNNVVINLIEVIEHLEKDKAMFMLKELAKLGLPMFITTPTHFYQSNHPEDPGYAHKSFYLRKEIVGLLEPFYKYYREFKIFDDIYRTEHQCYVFENNKPIDIPQGRR